MDDERLSLSLRSAPNLLSDMGVIYAATTLLDLSVGISPVPSARINIGLTGNRPRVGVQMNKQDVADPTFDAVRGA